MSNLPQLKQTLSNEQVKARFKEILGQKSAGFISSIISACSTNPQLQECDYNTIVNAAVIAATLDLPINSNLGFAHIVPYSGKAQFQMGWKGFVQLAMRTGQYKTINATAIFKGQLKSENPLTGEYEFDFSVKSDEIIGYAAFFKMLNGFEKTLYMTKEECEKHGKKYSKTFAKGIGRWKEDFDAMSLKTVIKMLLSKFGMLSIDMQKAVVFDQAVVKDAETGEIEYQDAKEIHTEESENPTAIKKELNGTEK